jgi:hypothetical protein
MKRLLLSAMFAGVVSLYAQDAGEIFSRQERADAQRAQIESDLREARRQAGAARAMASRALQSVNDLANQPIAVPGETAEQADARHQEVYDRLCQQTAQQFEKEHPFLPGGWTPEPEDEQLAQALRQSDEQAFAQAEATSKAQAAAQVATLEARITQLEQKLAILQQPIATPKQGPQEDQRAIDEYNRRFTASEAKATELYAFASRADSEGGKRMLEIEAELKAKNDPLYFSPDKPLIIARMVAREMRIAPRTKTPETVKPAPTFDETRARAERGEADAQSELGRMFFTGHGVPRNSAEAVKWLRKAADQGYAKAQTQLGFMYFIGDGVPKDGAEAARWYRKAADQGNADGQSLLGEMYATGNGVPKNSVEAVKWYHNAADQGNAGAQSNLGLMYANGEGVPKDSAEAVRWLRKAADQGDANAQNNLGLMFAKGSGVPEDSAQAASWFHKAANDGYADAQSNLGLIYANGNGVPKDEIEALAWYMIAAASGDDDSKKNRTALELRLGSEATLVAQLRSNELLKEIKSAKAHQAGYVTGDSPRSKSSDSSVTRSDREILQDLASEIKPSGMVVLGGSPYLLFHEKKVKAGDCLRITFKGSEYTVEIMSIAGGLFTIRLNDEKLPLPIRESP